MRIRQLAAVAFLVLGLAVIAMPVQAQGLVGPGESSAMEVAATPSALPVEDASGFAVDWRFWTAHVLWIQSALVPSPMRFLGAASPVTLPDRRWRRLR